MPSRVPRILLVRGQYGPSYVLCAKEPFRALQADGVCEVREADIQRPSGDLYWCDIVFVVRGFTPIVEKVVCLAKRLSRFVIVYWDDNIFEVPRARPDTPTTYERHEHRASILTILRLADMIAVCNPRLIAVLRSQGVVAPAMILPSPAIGLQPQMPHSYGLCLKPVIGYGGHVSHARQLQQYVVPALERLLQKGLAFQFEVIGPQLELPRALASVTKQRDFMPQHEWIAFRNQAPWTIALAPLPRSSFYECKYQNKFLEYSAGGIPTIFSNVPPYSDVIEHRRTGLLVENTHDAWADGIDEMIRNKTLRDTVAEQAWLTVNAEHSMEQVKRSYLSRMKIPLEFRHAMPNGIRERLWYAIHRRLLSVGERVQSGGVLNACGLLRKS